MREEATIPIELEESQTPIECNVIFYRHRNGTIIIHAVQKPVSKDPLCYADIEVSQKTLDWLESWLYDNAWPD